MRSSLLGQKIHNWLTDLWVQREERLKALARSIELHRPWIKFLWPTFHLRYACYCHAKSPLLKVVEAQWVKPSTKARISDSMANPTPCNLNFQFQNKKLITCEAKSLNNFPQAYSHSSEAQSHLKYNTTPPSPTPNYEGSQWISDSSDLDCSPYSNNLPS